MIGINDWASKIKEDQEMREPKLDREAQQIFRNAEADAAIQECNANILLQMFTSNEIIESTISEKIKELEHKQNKQSTAKIEPKLDVNLRNENDKTFFDDGNVSRKQHPSRSKRYYTIIKRI